MFSYFATREMKLFRYGMAYKGAELELKFVAFPFSAFSHVPHT